MLILTGVALFAIFGSLVRLGCHKLARSLRNGIIYTALGYVIIAFWYGGLHGILIGFFFIIVHVFTIQPIEALFILVELAEPSDIPNILLNGPEAHFCSDRLC